MPIKQLHVVEKIKFLVSGSMRTKKQIVDEMEKTATDHRVLNQRQEREDDARVIHAVKELQEAHTLADEVYSRRSKALAISVFLNFILLLAFAFMWYSLFYR